VGRGWGRREGVEEEPEGGKRKSMTNST